MKNPDLGKKKVSQILKEQGIEISPNSVMAVWERDEPLKRYKVAKPHLIPGTNIFKNKPGITNPKDLDRFELLSFLVRLDTTPDGDLSTDSLPTLMQLRMVWVENIFEAISSVG